MQTEQIVRIPPPRPEPLSKPDIGVRVLVPATAEELLYAELPDDPGLMWEFTYVILEWDDFLTLAQYMEEVKFKFQEYIQIVEYWEDGNKAETVED